MLANNGLEETFGIGLGDVATFFKKNSLLNGVANNIVKGLAYNAIEDSFKNNYGITNDNATNYQKFLMDNIFCNDPNNILCKKNR